MAACFPANQVIVVGGGLAGMAAANQVLECGGRVVVLEKSSFCGGNSAKAASGINAVGTRMQRTNGVSDSAESFVEDASHCRPARPELSRVMAANSGADVEWLADKFDLDLSRVCRLGGHSQARSHRGRERFPGMTITYALIQMVEKISEISNRAQIITKASVSKLIARDGAVLGCQYSKGGRSNKEYGPVVLATGGYGADSREGSLLAQVRPDLLKFPTTCGEHSTGDGIRMGQAVGARVLGLEWVQLHPTGLVKPEEPEAKVKLLASEALRAAGGLLLDAGGRRFVDELGRPEDVAAEVLKAAAPVRLVLHAVAAAEVLWHCRHYVQRGQMRLHGSGKQLAETMGIPVQVLADTYEAHHQAAEKTLSNPAGGPWPVQPSGSSWDEASGRTGRGKRVFPNTLPGAQVPDQPFYAATVTPAVHYCMGGLEITRDAEVIGPDGIIRGLYAAGEVAGGVHGEDRLGGSALLDCVVFGRVAAKAACHYAFGDEDEFLPCPIVETVAKGLFD